MARAAIGERVGAVMNADNQVVRLFGFGVYEGYVTPDAALGVQFMGGPIEYENPCILLDSGQRVFGCECWWGGEQAVRDMIGHRAIELIDITAERAKYRATPEHQTEEQAQTARRK
jgi:hypothetical protein